MNCMCIWYLKRYITINRVRLQCQLQLLTLNILLVWFYVLILRHPRHHRCSLPSPLLVAKYVRYLRHLRWAWFEEDLQTYGGEAKAKRKEGGGFNLQFKD